MLFELTDSIGSLALLLALLFAGVAAYLGFKMLARKARADAMIWFSFSILFVALFAASSIWGTSN